MDTPLGAFQDQFYNFSYCIETEIGHQLIHVQIRCLRLPLCFCDIQNNQGLGKVSVRVISLSLQLQLITLTSTLIILDIAKTSIQ